MKYIYLIMLAFVTSFCKAQSIEDVGKIVVGVDVPKSASSETLEIEDYLKNKISHWLTQTGYSSMGISPFYIYPEISIDTEDVAEGGMKNIYVIKGTLYLRLIQNDGNTVFANLALPFRESATLKKTAIKNGVSKIPVAKIAPLLDEAKDKILQYYETEKLNIFAQADLMARQKDYDGAIACLMSIPSCLTSIYSEALDKADEVLDEKTKAYNDSVLVLANSFLAQHNARETLNVLSSYQEAKEVQNSEYQRILAKAESLVTAAELAAAREKRQRYLDQKAREQHQWEVEDKERNHRINMDNKQMEYNHAALESKERITSQKIAADERTTARRIAADERTTARKIAADERITSQKNASTERLASQSIAANERITTHRINAIKSIAVNYYKSRKAQTLIVNHNY